MGVIKKILYRGQILGKPRHRNLFLDMEENIHIHYRDLRIELSRGEFEDIVNAFGKQSRELMAIIEEKRYQDGRLPNANQDDVRVWTESRLKHDVRYHPQRFSLEECGDGYHFHYRNYKLLIDKDEFHQIARLFAGLDLNGPYAHTYDEIVDLLEANDVDFTLDAGNKPGEALTIAVAQHHLPKVRDIFAYIGFESEDLGEGEKRYRGSQLDVLVRADRKRSALDYRRLRGNNAVVRLVDHLARHSTDMEPEELNLIKCQVLEFYAGIKSGDVSDAEYDPEAWLYAADNREVIFPHRSGAKADKTTAENVYRAWSTRVNGYGLGFVKPAKDVVAPAAQATLKAQVDEALRRDAAAWRAVSRIHLMGSAMRGDMGIYRAPFVHGKLVKLGSDVDVLIEIDPDFEADIPAHWHLHLPEASNHCAVYHLAEVPVESGADEWSRRFPHLVFTHHLLDAYVYFPSRGHADEKDAFLKKFGARLFYDRERDGACHWGEEESRIAGRMTELFGFPAPVVERLKVSTENALFKVFSERQSYVLKLFKVAGNHSSSRVAEHTAYEARLVAALSARDVPTAGVIVPAIPDATVEGWPALLFERIPGAVQQRPPYPLPTVCAGLAQIHDVQLAVPFDLSTAFTFDDSCMIWLPQFEQYLASPPAELATVFEQLAPIGKRWFSGDARAALFTRSPSVHCHGDVTPKNFLLDGGKARFFDFNNAFFGPRMADVIDGAFEFSLAEKYIHLADFARFDAFVDGYAQAGALSTEELDDIAQWIGLVGVIKFTKEVRVLLQRPEQNLRRKRAAAIAEFVLARCGA